MSSPAICRADPPTAGETRKRHVRVLRAQLHTRSFMADDTTDSTESAGPPADASVPPRRLTRLLPWLAGTLVVVTIAIISATLWVTREHYLHSAQVETGNLARVLEAQTATAIDGVDAILTGFTTIWAQIPAAKRPGPSDLHRLLHSRVLATELHPIRLHPRCARRHRPRLRIAGAAPVLVRRPRVLPHPRRWRARALRERDDARPGSRGDGAWCCRDA